MNIIGASGFLMKYGKTAIPIVYSLRTLPTLPASGITAACMNIDQTIIYTCISGGNIYKYTTASGSWAAASGPAVSAWGDIVCDDTGQYVVAVVKNTSAAGLYVWYSTNFGANFTQSLSTVSTNLESLAMSANGQYVYTISITDNTQFFRSTDYGVTWSNVSASNGTNTGSRVCCDVTGQYIVVAHKGTGRIRFSFDYGATFVIPASSTENAGAYVNPRIYNKAPNLIAWYNNSFTAGNWTALSTQSISKSSTITNGILSNPILAYNASNTPTSVAGEKRLDTTTSGKRIMVVETIAAGNVYLCSDGMVGQVTNGPSYAANFVNLSSTLGIPQTSWKKVRSNSNESFVFCNTNTVYVYEWSYAA
jgi:hypothetical protein